MITKMNSMIPLFKDLSVENLNQDIKQQSFKDFINQEVSQLAKAEQATDDSIKSLITGEVDNIHDVLIKTEEARLQLELAMQVRNKVVESYQEIMRMQV